jgi:hypothetical protein
MKSETNHLDGDLRSFLSNTRRYVNDNTRITRQTVKDHLRPVLSLHVIQRHKPQHISPFLPCWISVFPSGSTPRFTLSLDFQSFQTFEFPEKEMNGRIRDENRVAISCTQPWVDRKTTRLVVPVTRPAQTVHFGLNRNALHVTMIVCTKLHDFHLLVICSPLRIGNRFSWICRSTSLPESS